MKNIFSIGEVSKMFDVSIDTLRYYDKLEILSPEVNKENNYRMYTLRDIYLLSLILGARHLEVKIKDIKNFLDEEILDLDKYVEFIEKQNKILDNKIKDLKRTQKSLKNSEKIIKRARNYENIYEFSLIEIRKIERKFYILPIKKLISSSLCKRFSKVIEFENKSLEYFTEFKINYEEEKIYPVDEMIYIEKRKESDEITRKMKKKKLKIEEIVLEKDNIEIEFLGTEEELKMYIKELIKYFNIRSESILIKILSFFKAKNEEISFVQIVCNIEK
ncbi:MerR family transcriptional regulator [uncultured Clostridium sp.]|uniref:helix-turn-helix domain-containing protein n=1 Tax=uncultured Clostridium sp. TaxID=59620 RepID=UPI002607626D|nr:MerR family transcriptional regulator [uncultured Clostridium sp.]